jgi:hypothetical protein
MASKKPQLPRTEQQKKLAELMERRSRFHSARPQATAPVHQHRLPGHRAR